jgi:hypothetical protein
MHAAFGFTASIGDWNPEVHSAGAAFVLPSSAIMGTAHELTSPRPAGCCRKWFPTLGSPFAATFGIEGFHRLKFTGYGSDADRLT